MRQIYGAVFVSCLAVLAVPGLLLGDQTVTLPCNASVGISSYRGQMRQSNGGGVTSIIRQNQNWNGFEAKTFLMGFDTKAIQGWNIDKAYLNIYLAKGDLYGVGLCEVLAPWHAGDGVNFVEKIGASCWDFAKLPADPKHPAPGDLWAWPGSGIYSICWSHPAARYSHAGPTQIERTRVGSSQPEAGGAAAESPVKRFLHLRVPVDADLVASMAAGVSHGLIMTDDKGQVAEAYSLVGAGTPYIDNDAEDIYVFTHNVQDASLRPTLEVVGGPAGAGKKPGEARIVASHVSTDATEQVVLELEAPADGEGKAALAYEMAFGRSDSQLPPIGEGVPRWMLPRPTEPGTKQRIVMWGLPTGKLMLLLRTVDRAGRRSAGVTAQVDVPADNVQPITLAALPPAAPAKAGAAFAVQIVPDMVRVDPVSGQIICDGDSYGNTPIDQINGRVWDAVNHRVTLSALNNEVVAFNVVIPKGEKGVHDVKFEIEDLKSAAGGTIAAKNLCANRLWYIKSEVKHRVEVGPGNLEDHTRRPVAWQAEACVPLTEPFATSVSVPSSDNGIEGQTNATVDVDVYVPKGTAAGKYDGTIRLTSPDWPKPVVLPVSLSVSAAALPDDPTFPIELNCYGGLAGLAGVGQKDPGVSQAEWRFYALAKQHRLMINSLPYHQSGGVDAERVPVIAGEGADTKITDWKPFDDRYSPLLDGTAFDPAKGYVGPGALRPISHMYLPFNENWPMSLEKGYGDYANLKTRLDFAEWSKTSRPLDVAMSDGFKRGFESVVRQFVDHLAAKKWTATRYQVFFNNKYFYKVSFFSAAGGSHGSSFWLFDESVDYDDYAAMRFFHMLARGAGLANHPEVIFDDRADTSQPELTRGLFDGVVNLWMNGFGDEYEPTAKIRQKFMPSERSWLSGGGPGIAAAPVQTMQVLLPQWAEGADGALPYWTTLQGKNWNKADDLAIYYTGKNYADSGKNYPGPLPSLRMKIMRRCQQDIEMLELLAEKNGWSRAQAREALAPLADDPAAVSLEFRKMTWVQQEALRETVRGELGK